MSARRRGNVIGVVPREVAVRAVRRRRRLPLIAIDALASAAGLEGQRALTPFLGEAARPRSSPTSKTLERSARSSPAVADWCNIHRRRGDRRAPRLLACRDEAHTAEARAASPGNGRDSDR
jgi:hypothetical protein